MHSQTLDEPAPFDETEDSFGLGCFAFPLQARASFITLDDYYRRLKVALDALPEVTCCSIETLDDAEDRAEHIPATRTRDEMDESDFSNFPGLGFATLIVELAIPHDKSRALFREARLGTQRTEDFGEHFRLTIRDGYDMPVAIVESLDGAFAPPSDAVVLVREYFASCFAHSTGDIRFCALGPSPFHANLFLGARSGSGSLAVVNRSTGIGYDDILITFSLENLSSDEATELLKDRIVDELSLFYHFVETALVRSRTWNDIASRLATITHGARGADAALERLMRDVTEFRASDISYATQCTNSLRELYAGSELSIFRPRLAAQLDELVQYPTQDAIALIQFLEARRLKRMELGMLFLIGLAGGAVGALITRALTK